MRFHNPGFLEYLRQELPLEMAFMHHHHVVYIVSKVPIRPEYLQDVTARAVVRSMEHPIDPPRPTEERSLFRIPPEPHVKALRRALLSDGEYVQKTRLSGTESGGEAGRFEYQIDTRAVNRIVQRVRLQEDCKLIRRLIPGDRFCSIRVARKKIMLAVGRDFSKDRLEKALKQLERQGVLARPDKKNVLHTIGREVIAA